MVVAFKNRTKVDLKDKVDFGKKQGLQKVFLIYLSCF